MKINTKHLEDRSCTELKSLTQQTGLISAFVGDNDRTPLWDGHFIIRSENSSSNNSIIGKIDIQLKARSKETDKLKIKKKDLEIYKGRGLIYFLLIFDRNYKLKKYYYKSLLPEDIEKIINNNPNDKEYYIKFNNLKTSIELYKICLTFLEKSRLRSEQLLITAKEFNNLEIFKITTFAKDIEEFKKNAFNKDQTILLGKPKGVNEFKMIPNDFLVALGSINKIDVYVNNIKFYDHFEIINEQDKVYYKFGSIFISEDKRNISIRRKEQKSPLNVLHDINFILEYFKFGSITLNGKKFFRIGEVLSKHFENFVHDKKIIENIIDINNKIDLNDSKIDSEKITDYDFHNYTRLNNDLRIETGSYTLKIAEKNVLIMILNDGQKVECHSFFDIDKLLKPKFTNGEIEFESSHLFFLKDDVLYNIDNINFNKILESVNKYSNQENLNILNSFMLTLIKCYDKSQNLDFLNIAETICDKYNDSDIYYINKAQIMIRKDSLSKELIIKLLDIKSRVTDKSLICAIHLLLGSFYEFEVEFDKLEEKGKEVFMNYPIYNLYNKKQKIIAR